MLQLALHQNVVLVVSELFLLRLPLHVSGLSSRVVCHLGAWSTCTPWSKPQGSPLHPRKTSCPGLELTDPCVCLRIRHFLLLAPGPWPAIQSPLLFPQPLVLARRLFRTGEDIFPYAEARQLDWPQSMQHEHAPHQSTTQEWVPWRPGVPQGHLVTTQWHLSLCSQIVAATYYKKCKTLITINF